MCALVRWDKTRARWPHSMLLVFIEKRERHTTQRITQPKSCTLPTGKLSGGRIILCRCFSGISNCEFHQSGRNHKERKIYNFFERNPKTVSSITKQRLLLVKNYLKTDWLYFYWTSVEWTEDRGPCQKILEEENLEDFQRFAEIRTNWNCSGHMGVNNSVLICTVLWKSIIDPKFIVT